MRAAVLALVFACAPRFDLPVVIPDKAVREYLEVHPYFVSGESAAEARRGIAGKGDALTSWEVQYDYSLEEEGGVCRLREPHVTLAIRQSYPVAASTDPGVSTTLASGLDTLHKHEEGHLHIDRAAAHSLAQALRAVAPRKSCEAVREAAQRSAARVLADCKASNAAYDAATGHGAR
jgi:predicted secreted Zn-dependent protease